MLALKNIYLACSSISSSSDPDASSSVSSCFVWLSCLGLMANALTRLFLFSFSNWNYHRKLLDRSKSFRSAGLFYYSSLRLKFLPSNWSIFSRYSKETITIALHGIRTDCDYLYLDWLGYGRYVIVCDIAKKVFNGMHDPDRQNPIWDRDPDPILKKITDQQSPCNLQTK